jgi:thioredoxin-related protein
MHRIFLLPSLFLLTFAHAGPNPMGSEGKTLLLPEAPRQQIERTLLQQKRSAQWSEDYIQTLTKAQENGKPLVLAFMGAGWCPWSEKLEKEILSDPAFLDPLKGEVNLVWLNCPSSKGNTTLRVQELKSLYQINELPTIVVITPMQEEMFRIGYLPLTPADYATRLQKMIADYNEVNGNVDGQGGYQELSSLGLEDLQRLYVKARELKASRYVDRLMALGLEKDKGTFFLLEKYADLLESGNKAEAEVFKEKIIDRDPKNLKGSQLRLAILDFQVKSHHQKKKSIKSAVKPLADYLTKFGEKDKENAWRVEMMMAQYLFTKNEVEEALKHANASFTKAPEEQKAEIAQTVDYLKTYVK